MTDPTTPAPELTARDQIVMEFSEPTLNDFIVRRDRDGLFRFVEHAVAHHRYRLAAAERPAEGTVNDPDPELVVTVSECSARFARLALDEVLRKADIDYDHSDYQDALNEFESALAASSAPADATLGQGE